MIGGEQEGVGISNITGMSGNDKFVYDADTGGPGIEGFNSITLLTVAESFKGELSITFAEDDITLYIQEDLPIDTYAKEMTLTIT